MDLDSEYSIKISRSDNILDVVINMTISVMELDAADERGDDNSCASSRNKV